MDNKLIQDQLASIPQEVKDSIAKVPWQNKIKDIAKAEHLTSEQANSLETETMFIIYGFFPPNELGKNILTELGIDNEKVERLVNSISKNVFAEIEKQYEQISTKNSATLLPEVLPNEKSHNVPHVEITPRPQAAPEPLLQSQPISSPLPQPPAPVPPQPAISKPPPPPPAPKQNLASTPTYAEPSQIGPNDDKSKRPDLNFPQSSYNSGQDPYREPLE